jgi:hypothetical protein
MFMYRIHRLLARLKREVGLASPTFLAVTPGKDRPIAAGLVTVRAAGYPPDIQTVLTVPRPAISS